MDAQRELEGLCRRHGVPWKRGKRLLPLVRRAASADAELRRHLLGVIEATLARDAHDLSRSAARDELALIAVAGALHRWSAPTRD